MATGRPQRRARSLARGCRSGSAEGAVYRRRVVATVGVKRTIWWDGQSVTVIDQRYLPHRYVTRRWRTVDDVAEGIRGMQVRGAPLIGVAAAHGVALAMAADARDAALDHAMETLSATRPTAVSLRNALERIDLDVRPRPNELRAAAARVLAERLADDDATACRAIGEIGARLITDVADRVDRPVQVLTHCNAGWLACVEWGTATAPVYIARERGIDVHVWVSETRPRNQGASLTAWELSQRRIPHTVIVDNAAGHLLASGQVDLVLVGADRIAVNGDVANKIGTYLKALAARDSHVPFYVAAPTTTFDMRAATGAVIPIEERGPERGHQGVRPSRQRPHRRRHRHAAGHRGAQLGLRRHAGPTRLRVHHRAGPDRRGAVRHRPTPLVSLPVTGGGRREVVSAARRLSAWGLNVGTAGNVGLRVDGGLLVTPSGVPAEDLREEDVVALDADGAAAAGSAGADQRMAAAHGGARRRVRTSWRVVHTHSPEATAAACVARRAARPIHYVVACAGRPTVPCAHVRHLRLGGAGRQRGRRAR